MATKRKKSKAPPSKSKQATAGERGPHGRLLDWAGKEKTEFVRGMARGQWANLLQYARAKGIRTDTVRRQAAKHGWHEAAEQVQQQAQGKALEKLEDQVADDQAEARKRHLDTANLMHQAMVKGLILRDHENKPILLNGKPQLVELTASEGIRAGRAAVLIERQTLGMEGRDQGGAGAVMPAVDDSIVREIKGMSEDEKRRRIKHLKGILDAGDS